MRPTRVWGPYQDAQGWRLVIRDSLGRRTVRCASKAEAEDRAAAARLVAPGRGASVDESIDDYLRHLADTGRRPGTRRTYESALRLFCGEGAGQVRRLTAAWLQGRVAARRAAGRSVDTVASELRMVKTWLRWAQWPGDLDAVRVEGRRRRGKPQLTVDEARRFLAVALAQPGEVAVAVAGPLLMGVSGREVWGRRVRDIDCDGSVWIVTDGKTDNRARRVEVPGVLRPMVATLTEGRGGEEWLFVGRGKGSRKQTWCQQRTASVCREAGVPAVCPHGLRGTHATLAVGAGATSAVVASALGHGSSEVTRRHYVTSQATQQATQQATLRTITGR